MKPVSKTAYYCCGVRMADAERKRPLCGDTYARRFMDEEGRAIFAAFSGELRAQRGNAARARIIDDHLRAALRTDPALLIFTVGAGFDSRPYRLHGGRWVELDEAPLIELKNARLPLSECKNALTRVPIDFASESLEDKLQPFRTDAFCIFVFEGVFMYLTPEAVRATLTLLRRLFPRHELVCDLMQPDFMRKHSAGVRAKVEQLGAVFRMTEDPEQVVLASGYQRSARISIAQRGMELSVPALLAPLMRFLPRDVREGYQIGVFRPFEVG